MATRSMLLDNCLNTSSAHLSALSWHLFKREVSKDKLTTLCQPLLRLGWFLSKTYTSLQKKKCVFQLKLFLSDRRTVDLTQLLSIIFSCFCFFRKGLVYLRLQFSWANILHLACYFSLVPYGNSTDLHLNEFFLYSVKLCKASRRTDVKSPSALLQLTQALELMGVFSNPIMIYFLQPARKMFS